MGKCERLIDKLLEELYKGATIKVIRKSWDDLMKCKLGAAEIRTLFDHQSELSKVLSFNNMVNEHFDKIVESRKTIFHMMKVSPEYTHLAWNLLKINQRKEKRKKRITPKEFLWILRNIKDEDFICKSVLASIRNNSDSQRSSMIFQGMIQFQKYHVGNRVKYSMARSFLRIGNSKPCAKIVRKLVSDFEKDKKTRIIYHRIIDN